MKKLGFGLMRLPVKDGSIDIEHVSRMADEFLNQGFTYFDTAYVYKGSEIAFREAVVKRHPRNSFTVASKMDGRFEGETYSMTMEQKTSGTPMGEMTMKGHIEGRRIGDCPA